MTDAGYTHLVLLTDRSGSMQSICADAEGGVNRFITEQREATEKGERCTVTLAEFDTDFDVVYENKDIFEIPDPAYKLRPRGMTALLDSLGKLINSTGEYLGGLPENSRPATVLFIITTDGYENASKEFTREQIREMITRQQDHYSWKFIYLGANQDAITEAGSLGIPQGSTINYNSTPQSTQSVYSSLSGYTTTLRGGAKDATFTQADRDAANS